MKISILTKIPVVLLGLTIIFSHFNPRLINLPFIPQIYLLEFAILLFAVWGITNFFLSNNSEKTLNNADIFVFIYVILYVTSYLTSKINHGQEMMINVAISGLVYFAIRLNKDFRHYLRYFIFPLLIIIGIIEITTVYLQFLNIIGNINSNYRIGGVWGHPATTACIITLCLPFIIFGNFKESKYKFIKICLILLISFSYILLESRTAIISLLILCATFTFVNSRGRIKLSKKYRIAGLFILIGLLCCQYFLLPAKQDSTKGRIFIWNQSFELAIKKPLKGSGIGSFQSEFAKHQSEYFKAKQTDGQELLADYIGLAYNDFMEMFVELGFKGPIILLLLMFSIYKNLSLKSRTDKAISLSLLSLLPWLLTWSILKIFAISSLVFLLFGIIKYKREYEIKSLKNRIKSKFILGVLLMFLSLSLFLVYQKSTSIMARYHYSRAEKAINNQNIEQALSHFEIAYPILKFNENFTGKYLTLLNDYNHDKKAIEIAIENSLLFNSPSSFMILGNLYKKVNNTNLALTSFKKALFISPSKLYPKYCIVKIYYENNYDSAFILAKIDEILHAPQKFMVADSYLIIEELKSIKKSLQQLKQEST